MKDIVLLLFISFFCQITSKCETGGFNTYEECFSREITGDEIRSGESVDDYTCCYLRQLPSHDGQCMLLKNTDIPTYIDLLDECGIPHDVFACSEDELPDQSKSTSCFLLSPLKKTDCFTRSLSDLEKGDSEDNNVQCCYIAFNNMKECMAVPSSNIDYFKTKFIEAHLNYGYVINSLDVICGDSNGESSEGSNNDSNNGSNNGSNNDSNEGSNDSNNGSINDSNEDSNDQDEDENDLDEGSDYSNKDSSGTIVKIFGISYFIWTIILFA